MAAIKTTKNDASVEAFLATIKNEDERTDSETIVKMMKQVSKQEPVMWGTSIIGVGAYQYKSPATGKGGDWFMVGFSPRKQGLTLYLMPGITHYKEEAAKLGKYKVSGSCIHIKKLADVDTKALKELITAAYKNMKVVAAKNKI